MMPNRQNIKPRSRAVSIAVYATLLIMALATTRHSDAGVFNVGTLANLITRINSANPGDKIILSNGIYNSTGTINISRSGTATQPILIAAQSVGGAQIGGVDGFNLVGANYVTIQGFYFTYTNSGTQGLIVDTASTHCRITRNIFETDPVQYWCFVQGDDTEVDHNLFRNKVEKGEYITLDGDHTALTIAKRAWVHDNNFYNNQYPGSNGGESVRLGIGIYQLISSWTVVENNLFDQADGDPEAISVKSSDCVIRYNTLTNSSGQISLRSQNRGRIEGNFMINSSGIRFYGDDNLIINNYMQGSDGIVFGSGEVPQITDSENASTNGLHAAAHRARVEFNTLVNSSVYFDEDTRGYYPSDFIVANNLLQGNSGTFVSSAASAGQSNFTWQTNIFWGTASYTGSPAGGYQKINPQLATNTAVPFHIASNSPATNASYAAISEVVYDMDGQLRSGNPDIGADEFSSATITRRPLNTNDVGPYVAATNFAIAAMPWTQMVMPGRVTTYTNLLSAYNGFTNTVTLSVTNLPSGASASFSKTSISNGVGVSVLTVTASNTAPAGRYTLLITGTSSTFTNTTTAFLTVGNLPANWTDADINNPTIAGAADYYMNVFAVEGSGSALFGTSDQFNYVYQPWTNGLTVTARVATQPNTSTSAKSGVMIRESTNSNSKYVDVVVTPNSINFETRAATGGSAVQLTTFTAANSTVGTNSPSWVRLTRSGNTFTGYASSNGVTWVQMGVTNLTMTNTLTGLAVCGYNNTQLNTSTFDNVNVASLGDMPVVTNQPVTQVVTFSSNATFTVGASGTAPLSYQWRFNTNTILAGATTASLTITNAQSTNAGSYTVIVTNVYGAATSAVAALTIVFPPVISNGSMSANYSMLTLTGTGTPSQTYVLQTTTNLTSPAIWARILTNTTDGSGQFVFTNLLSPGNSHQFYRVLSP